MVDVVKKEIVEQPEAFTITHRCFVCARDMHIEEFDGNQWRVCDDPDCGFMELVE